MRPKSPQRAEQGGETCGTCDFWRPAAAGKGACRRYPPAATSNGFQSPETASGFWCGEWRKLRLSTL